MQAAWSRYVFVAGLALVAVPSIANAQDARGEGLWAPAGQYFLVGGGVTGFTEGDAKDRFEVGGAWDLRVGLGNRFWVGGELAYVGASLGADASGPDFLANGGEAVLRLQYPHAAGSWLVEPFLFGGVGWSRVSLRDAPPGAKDSDDVGVLPFGAGLTLGYRRFLLDARFTYRAPFDEDLPVADGAGPADLQQWGVTTSIGYEF